MRLLSWCKMTNDKLVKLAMEVMKNTYSPYSNFPVGAAIEMNDGTVFQGANVENASYGATICAERSAIVSAVAKGYKPKDFKKIAIVSKMNSITPPCAVCRQVLVEFFAPDAEVIMASVDGEYKIATVNELVPYSFTEEELGDVN